MGDVIQEKKLAWWHYALLALVLLTCFAMIYKAHHSYDETYYDVHGENFIVKQQGTSYPYPFHADEWTHLGQTIYIMDEHKVPTVNPYVQSQQRLDLEAGFHAFMAAFFGVTGLDPITTYQYLPAIFMIITALSLFIFIYVATRNYLIALLSPMFLVLIRNNINLMGLWFLLPMTFSLFLIFSFLAAYISKGRTRYLAIVFFITAVLTYPFAAMMIAIAVVLYELHHYIIHKSSTIVNRDNWKYYLAAIVALAALTLLLMKGRISQFPLIFRYGWTINFEHTYMPWEMYSILALILAAIGIWFAISRRQDAMLLALPAICLVPIMTYMTLRFTLLIPYQRAFFFFLVGLAPLSALGAFYLYKIFESMIRQIAYTRSARFSAISAAVLIAAILVLTFTLAYKDYYRIDDSRFRLVHYVQQTDYDAMKWIGRSYPAGTVIMADMFTSFTIYPITHMQAVAVAPSNLEAGNATILQQFYSTADCSARYQLLAKTDARLVMSSIPIKCSYLKEVYNKGTYVYERG